MANRRRDGRRAVEMNAVIVSFHFLAPNRPCEQLLAAHHERLDSLDEVVASVALDSRSEVAFLLMYERQDAIEAYFASEEFQHMSTQPGCYDVFVKEFHLLPEPTADIVIDVQLDDAVAASTSIPGTSEETTHGNDEHLASGHPQISGRLLHRHGGLA
jgi:hypothetical protein